MEQVDPDVLRREFARLHQRLDAIERKIDAITGMPAASSASSPPLTASINVPEGVLHLLRAGQKQQAIDAYHQLAGVDLKTAEMVVGSLALQHAAGSRS